MIPWVKHAAALAPDGTEISLWQRGDEHVVRAGGVDLMSTRTHGSEELLAEHGCAGLGEGASVLVGGLGLGFTLRAALAVLPPGARVVVAELCPAIVEWVRGPLGNGALLDDPRVTVDARDCAAILRESAARFDAILLDVDNGPSALTQSANRWLYEHEGLKAAARALRAGGRLAVWSAGPDEAFVERLGRAGFGARTVPVRAHRAAKGAKGQGARHVVFLGVRRG
jgi:spermidine synthase